MVQRRGERKPSVGLRVLDAYGSSSPGEIAEATACAAYDHRCPTCGAEVERPCRDLRQEWKGRLTKHPHVERLWLPSAEEVVDYLGR